MTVASIWSHVSAWEWGDIGTWVGTGIAAISAVVSWRKASEAKQMRDAIAKRKDHGDLSGLNGILTGALRAMEKYAPGAGINARRGSSPDSDAAAVRSLTSEMARLRGMLDRTFGKAAVSRVLNCLNNLLTAFGNAPNDNDRVSKGRDIYNEIVEFSGNIKSELDGNIYG